MTKLIHRTVSLCIVFILLMSFFCVNTSAVYGDEPEITAKTALLYSLDNDLIMYEKDIHEKLYPASVTKIMTALLTLEYCNPDDIVTVTKSALDAVPAQSSIAGLKVGEELTVHDMLICLLVPSGNDTANILAEHIGGTIGDFIDMMNTRAEELGCKNTHFANAHGFHDEEHYTTAYDVLLIVKEAMKHDLFNEIVGSAQLSIPATNLEEERIFNSTNYLLSSHVTSKYLYDYAIGTKTGRTTPAGNCLVAAAKKDGITLISVILGADTVPTSNGGSNILSFSETKALFNWGYKNFSYRTVVKENAAITEVSVALAEAKDFVILNPKNKISHFVHDDVKNETFEIKYTVNEEIIAPISQGEKLGSLRVYYKGEIIGETDLIAMNSVERSDILYYFDQMQKFFAQPIVKIVILAVIILILIFVIYMVIINIRNQRRRASMRRRRRY